MGGARSAPQGLTTMRTLFTCSLNWELRSKHGVYGTPTPTLFPTNSLYTPMDNTPLHSISSVRHPWGKTLLSSLLVGRISVTGDSLPCTLHLLAPFIGNKKCIQS